MEMIYCMVVCIICQDVVPRYSSSVRYAMNSTELDTSFRDKWYRVDMDVGRNGRLNLSPSFRDSILVDLDV